MISNDAWKIEANLASSKDGVVIVELRLSSAWIGDLPPFTISLEAEPTMSRADYEAQALILMAGSVAELENACIRESVRKSR